MRKSSIFAISIFLLALCLTACDSGDIEEHGYSTASGGLTLRFRAQLSSQDDWEETGYGIVLAGFSDQSSYAVLQRPIPLASMNGEEMEMVVSNVSNGITTMELTVTNTLRKRIVTFRTVSLEAYKGRVDTIDIDLGRIDVGLSGFMQQGIFNQACIQCHGGNGRKAGTLDLTDGMALQQLIDVPSSQKPGYTRIVSGDAEGSLLRMILHEGGENLLNYNHTEVLSSQFKESLEDVKNLIDEWINSL